MLFLYEYRRFLRRKSRIIILFALALLLLIPGMAAEAKTKPKLAAKKKPEPVADNPVLNIRDVALYYLSEEYKDYITFDSSHLREYRFRVSGTKKEVREWQLSGPEADYFSIMDYGLLQMDWKPAYVKFCVTATVTAVLEDGRTLTAAVRGGVFRSKYLHGNRICRF